MTAVLIFLSLVTLALVQTGPVKSQSIEPPENQQSYILTLPWLRITDVQISQPITFYDIPPSNSPNSVVLTNVLEEASPDVPFRVLRPSLNSLVPFTIIISVQSEVQAHAVIKIFAGPPGEFLSNWSDFAQIDWLQYNLTPGRNVVERSSEDFFQFTDDSQNIKDIYLLLDQNQLPDDMEKKYAYMPKRTVLPNDTKNGVPLQFFVVLYPSSTREDLEPFKDVILDDKPFAYPLDRPILPIFLQPNMYLKDSAA